MASTAAIGRGRGGRLDGDAPDRRRARHLALAARRARLGRRRRARPRRTLAGTIVAAHAHHLRDRAHRLLEVPGRVDEPDEQEVADGVPGQLADGEAVLEGRGERVGRVGQRAEALAQVADRRDAEHRAQPAGRPAVVGHRDDPGDLVGAGARARAARPRSRGRRPRRRPSSGDVAVEDGVGARPGAGASPRRWPRERWRPPVQPDRDREVGLALGGEGRDLPLEHGDHVVPGTAGPAPGPGRSRPPAASSPDSGRSSSTQCGLGRKRQSKTRSTSRGMPLA